MKVSAFILSFCGLCIFYICNADWIDELIDDYLGGEYEEVAPFVSSVTAGTEEFDYLVEELRKSRSRWLPPRLVLLSGLGAAALSALLCYYTYAPPGGRDIVKAGLELVTCCCRFQRPNNGVQDEIQRLVSEYLEKRFRHMCGRQEGDDVPVKLLWKGGTLVESSVHCNIRDDSRMHQVQKHRLHSKLLFRARVPGKGDAREEIAGSESEESTAQRMADIRKLLESEQEIMQRLGNKGAGTEEGKRPENACLSERKLPEEKKPSEGESETDRAGGKVPEDPEPDVAPDSKLMNRIRLLESRLRLEELKNKNWINRMSRAEGILQQLNKQVERIEETRPVETLTETLEITSTVTNWPSYPRRNLQFTMVNSYPSFCFRPPSMSLTELIRKEVGLPCFGDQAGTAYHVPPSSQVPALPPPTTVPQSSLLSKFFSR